MLRLHNCEITYDYFKNNSEPPSELLKVNNNKQAKTIETFHEAEFKAQLWTFHLLIFNYLENLSMHSL